MAYRLLGSERLRQAFDLGRGRRETRDLYGMTLFGQAALTARRLVEAGGRFVSVFWDEYGLAGTGWDTHWDHFPRMKDELLPGLDRTFSGLLLDLDRRGLLDETLVVLLSEHGRTPRIQRPRAAGATTGRAATRCVMAGGGIARGQVVGRSDKIASDPLERPVSPKDILATALHLLGIDPKAELHDRQGRPLPLVPTGQVIPEALAWSGAGGRRRLDASAGRDYPRPTLRDWHDDVGEGAPGDGDRDRCDGERHNSEHARRSVARARIEPGGRDVLVMLAWRWPSCWRPGCRWPGRRRSTSTRSATWR